MSVKSEAVLVSKKRFSELANVSQAAITQACKGILKPACVGRRIDPTHKSAIAYIDQKKQDKIDEESLHTRAKEVLEKSESKTPYALRKAFGMNYHKANRLFEELTTQAQSKKSKPISKEKKTERVENKKSKPETIPTEKITVKPVVSSKIEQPTKKSDIDCEDIPNLTIDQIAERYGTEERFFEWLKARKLLEEIREKQIKNAKSQNELVSLDLVKKGIIAPVETLFSRLLYDATYSMASQAINMRDSGEDEVGIRKMMEKSLSNFIKATKNQINRGLSNAVK